MARKAIVDAKNAGLRYFRIGASGYAPSSFGLRGDLDSWLADGEAYWQSYDRMMKDLADNGIRIIPSFVWNLPQFPSMARETVRDLIVDSGSRSSRLLDDYISEFATRYRNHPALLFYEIGNELNLGADLDLVRRCMANHYAKHCEAQGNYTTDEMIAFTQRVARRLRGLDPSRPISSGHSFPRPAAQHLRRSPEFSYAGADWTKDSIEDLADYLDATHRDLEILSVHIYETTAQQGAGGSGAVERIVMSDRLARKLGKTLFIGEIGGPSSVEPLPESFLNRALTVLQSQKVPYAALWVWQYYQGSTYRSFDSEATRFNIEPGYSDWLIRRIAAMNAASGDTIKTARDSNAPTVIITWPLECAVVTSPVTLYIAASDDSLTPPTVEIQHENRTVTAGRRPPYQARIDGLGAGENDFVASATDGSGNRAVWRTTVVVGPVSAEQTDCRRCCR